MVRLLLTLTAAAMSVTAARSDEKADLARFQGTWRVVKAVRNGAEAPDIVREALRVTITSRTLMIRSADDVPTIIQADMVLDPSKNPAQIDLKPAPGSKLPKLLGIYRLDGETVRLCWSTDGITRPNAFVAAPGNKVVSFELSKAIK